MNGLLSRLKSGSLLSRIAFYAAAPLFVLVILAFVYAFNGMYPFGTADITCGDMRQQVVPLLLDFKDILAGKDSLFLNMHSAAGMNFYGVFLFFMSSPFSFLVAFVDKADMAMFMNVLTALKMATCALTATIYFRYCHKKLNPFYTVIISVSYAFSGYSMLFFQNNVWLDVMYLFPLLLMSCEALLKRGKTVGFILCLVGMLALNFYISYMIVIFVILYFAVYIFTNRKKNDTKAISAHFAVSCIIAALMSAIIWLPALGQYLGSARGTDIIDRMLKSNFFTPIYTNLPFIFCSALMLIFAVAFFRRGITSTSRLYTIMFILTVIPVVVDPINKMWHTGDYMCFPIRYGFITTFMLLCVVASKLKKQTPDKFAKKGVLPITILSVVGCAAVSVLMTVFYHYNRETLDAYICTLWGDSESFLGFFEVFIAFAITTAAILSFAFTKKISFRTFAVCISVLLVGECVFNAHAYLVSASKITKSYHNTIELADVIPEDDDFYRVKMEQGRSKYFDANLLGGLGYNTIAHYTSLTSKDYMYTMKRLGYSSYWMEVTGNGGTLFTDALLSNKYTIAKFSAKENAVFRNKNYSVLENEFYLPLGIITSADLSEMEEIPELDRIEVQEYMAEKLFGVKDMFERYTPTNIKNAELTENAGRYYYKIKNNKNMSTLSYNIYVDDKQTLYFDCFDKITSNLTEHINNSFTVYVNGLKINNSYPNKDINGLLELGTFENAYVKIDIDLNKSDNCASFGVYGLKHSAMQQVISNSQGVNLRVSGNEITGSVSVEGEPYLYVSVPYYSGFTARINGKEAPVLQSMSSFMTIKLSEGENNIVFSFMPKGFKEGLILSSVGVLLFVLAIVFRNRIKMFAEKTNKFFNICVMALGAIVVLVVYAAPLVLNIVGNIFLK